MSYSSGSVDRRSVSSVIASAVVGVALGVVSVIGVASFSGQEIGRAHV